MLFFAHCRRRSGQARPLMRAKPAGLIGAPPQLEAPAWPGDAVVIEEPVYYPFRQVVEDNGRAVVSVPLTRDADGVYRRDPAALGCKTGQGVYSYAK